MRYRYNEVNLHTPDGSFLISLFFFAHNTEILGGVHNSTIALGKSEDMFPQNLSGA